MSDALSQAIRDNASYHNELVYKAIVALRDLHEAYLSAKSDGVDTDLPKVWDSYKRCRSWLSARSGIEGQINY